MKLFASYLTGFIASLLLTVAAFILVEIHIQSEHTLISHEILAPTLISLALIQFAIQLFFFLHLGSEGRSRYKLMSLFLALGLILILVVGSLWIMNHLNYSMTPDQTMHYMQAQQGGF